MIEEKMFVVADGKGVVLSPPMTEVEANETAIELSIIYKGLHLVPTDKKPKAEKFVPTIAAEEVEDTNCAGGRL